jgi:hypothetical protein
MKLILDDGQEIDLDSVKVTEVYPHSTVILKAERLSEIKRENLEMIRSNLKMIFFPARILIFDKTAGIEITEMTKPEEEKKIVH